MYNTTYVKWEWNIVNWINRKKCNYSQCPESITEVFVNYYFSYQLKEQKKNR